MAIVLLDAVQTGLDTATGIAIQTGLTADGKTAWMIKAMEVEWVNIQGAPAQDWKLTVALKTTNITADFSSPDEICRVEWAMQNTGGVAVSVYVEPVKSIVLMEPRVTVQPTLYIRLDSAATGLTGSAKVRVYYDIVKLTDVEVLRLLAGGA